MVEFRRSYVHKYGGRTSEHTVTVSDARVTVAKPENAPSVYEHSLAAAFERPYALFVRDRQAAFDVIQNVASRLRPEDLRHEVNRRRLAYWRAYRSDALAAERLAYVHRRPDGSVEHGISWRIDGLGLFWKRSSDEPELVLPDEVFVLGPPTLASPAWHRERLREAFHRALSVGADVTIEQSFPRLDHAACPQKSWSWNHTADGEEFATIGPGYVLAGSQFRYDIGHDPYSPERVLTDRQGRVNASRIPDAVYAEIVAILGATRLSAAATATVSEDTHARACAEALARLPKHVPWAHEDELTFAGFGATRGEPQWEGSAALGLLASLAPERPLPVFVPQHSASERRGLYDFGTDELWLASHDAGVLSAMVCHSNAGGIDRVWHVFPAGDRRVVFSIGTDYTQEALTVRVSAETPDALAALRAHVEAYFAALFAA